MNNAIYFPAFGDVTIGNNVNVNPANGSVQINGVCVNHYGFKQNVASDLSDDDRETYEFLKSEIVPVYSKVDKRIKHDRYVFNQFIYDIVTMLNECDNPSLIAMQSIKFSR